MLSIYIPSRMHISKALNSQYIFHRTSLAGLRFLPSPSSTTPPSSLTSSIHSTESKISLTFSSTLNFLHQITLQSTPSLQPSSLLPLSTTHPANVLSLPQLPLPRPNLHAQKIKRALSPYGGDRSGSVAPFISIPFHSFSSLSHSTQA